tara:strand:+ start:183 stop:887 length:705 start_codon:yes stop_codon:yes gene_type:complete
MAKSRSEVTLSVIIPTFNEASRLPLLLADIKQYPNSLEINIVDAESNDLTDLITKLANANFYHCKKRSRGKQLQYGASISKGDWLLFIHADSRLTKGWYKSIIKTIENPDSSKYGWYFDFKINSKSPRLKILEAAVSLRCNLFKTPYGDQGLLINKYLYEQIGGYSSIDIMEDIDLIERLKKRTKVKRLHSIIYTSPRKWQNKSIIIQAIKNASLIRRWKNGEGTKGLFQDYYL